MGEGFSVNYSRSVITLDSGEELSFDSAAAFSVISEAWLRLGWDTKYVYGFSWLGRPIIQLPEDILAIQELISTHEPDMVIETGVAHGGSLVLYASLLEAMGHGHVIGVDIDIRQHNRVEIEKHRLSRRISLVEGDSIHADTVSRVAQMIPRDSRVVVILDGDHSYRHVHRELELYSQFLSVGDWIIACDGIMSRLVGAPRSEDDWQWNNPAQAALDFAKEHADFVIAEPPRSFNEGTISERVTYWPMAYLQKVR